MFSIARPQRRLKLATFAALAAAAGALAISGAIQASADDLGPFTCTDRSGGTAPAPGDIRASELSGPASLMIDVQTPPEVTASAAPAATTSAAPSTAATASAVPSDLAATGHPASAGQPAGMPIAPILLGLLAVTAGLTIAGLRRFARKCPSLPTPPLIPSPLVGEGHGGGF